MIYCDVCMEDCRIIIVLGAGSISFREECLDFVYHPLYKFNLLQTCFEVLNLFMSEKK